MPSCRISLRIYTRSSKLKYDSSHFMHPSFCCLYAIQKNYFMMLHIFISPSYHTSLYYTILHATYDASTSRVAASAILSLLAIKKQKRKKFHGLSPRANCTDRVTATCRRSDCQLLQIEGATWSA
jgi:hypothetical protein